MDEDARIFGIKNCWMVTRDSDERKGFFEEVKTQGMYCGIDDD